jgi:cbb3-type cytochrome oxidase maturation protein
MTIPPAVILLVLVALMGAALALAAFVWAVRNGQLDPTNTGAWVIFDAEEPAGTPTDQIFPSRKEHAPS